MLFARSNAQTLNLTVCFIEGCLKKIPFLQETDFECLKGLMILQNGNQLRLFLKLISRCLFKKNVFSLKKKAQILYGRNAWPQS